MRTTSRIAAVLFLSFLAAGHAIAQCPDGKSEVVVVTPSGLSKTICVSDNALPGIETAAENAVLDVVPPPACPCLDLWMGIYSPAVTVVGSPPVLPADLAAWQCGVNHGVITTELVAFIVHVAAFVARHQVDDGGTCVANVHLDEHNIAYQLNVFTDAEQYGNGIIESPQLAACKQILVDRGCNFTQ